MTAPTPQDIQAASGECPFCGAEAKRFYSKDRNGEYFEYKCGERKCIASTIQASKPTEAEAIAAWNTRKSHAPAAEMRNIGPIYDGMKFPKGAIVHEDLTMSVPIDVENPNDTKYLISVLADIREKTGVGSKPMLSELANAIVKKHEEDSKKSYYKGFSDDIEWQERKNKFTALTWNNRLRSIKKDGIYLDCDHVWEARRIRPEFQIYEAVCSKCGAIGDHDNTQQPEREGE